MRYSGICGKVQRKVLELMCQAREDGGSGPMDTKWWREPYSRERIHAQGPHLTQRQWIRTWSKLLQNRADLGTVPPKINCKMLLLSASQCGSPNPFPDVHMKPSSANTWPTVMHPSYHCCFLFVLWEFEGNEGEREGEATVSSFRFFHSWLKLGW